jgi:hypothetical protein
MSLVGEISVAMMEFYLIILTELFTEKSFVSQKNLKIIDKGNSGLRSKDVIFLFKKT